MTRIVKEYVSTNGTKYELKEFDSSQLYHPNTVRAVKSSNQEYYDAISADKKRAKLEEAQAAKPKVLSDDDRFAIAVAAQKVRDDERQQYADREAEKDRQHQEFLNSSPPLVQVTNTNFYVFQQEMYHWQSKNYSIIVDSLEALVPSLFSCQLSAPAASKK